MKHMQRRQFLKTTIMGVAALSPKLGTSASNASAPALAKKTFKQDYMIAMTDILGQHQITKLSAQGDVLFALDMPSRRHSFAINYQKKQVLSIGRRPSTNIVVADFYGHEHKLLNAEPGRHFYGHGVFCKNERYLYTTENDYEAAKGIIGVRDAHNGYRLVTEYSSHGIGPHAIELSNDGKTLLVANGGVSTHPASGRKKLNVATMLPSLTVIDQSSGQLIKRMTLSEQQRHNSIRHLARNDKDQIVIALQNQLPEKTNEVLLASYDNKEDRLQALEIPQHVSLKLNSYLGDIVYDQSQQYFAASAPRGNCVLIYTAAGEFISDIDIVDASGVNATQQAGEFIVASGTGRVMLLTKSNDWKPQNMAIHEGNRWDNHLFLFG